MATNALPTAIAPPATRAPSPVGASSIARTPEEMRRRIRELAPAIAARADEFEDMRRIPEDVIQQLREIGVFRMSTPVSHGGLEFDYMSMLSVLTELAAVNSALGWVSMLGAGHIFYLAYLPRASYDEIYANGPDVFLAGSAGPLGRGEIVEGGYRVSGRWPTASGCQNSDWMFAGFIVTKDGETVMVPGTDAPLMKHVTLPASAFEIEDTWHVAGLKGTGSHHIRLKDQFVAEEFTWRYEDPSCLPGPLFQSGLHMVPLLHSAMTLGVAEAAIRDVVALAKTGKWQVLATEAMQDSPLFRADLGALVAELKAARAFQESQARHVWQVSLDGALSLADKELLSQMQQTAIWITDACVRIVDGCYRMGGTTSIQSSSPLQRHLRDVHAMSQHAAVNRNGYIQAGAYRLGIATRQTVLSPA